MDHRVFYVRCWLYLIATFCASLVWREAAMCAAVAVPMLLCPVIGTTACGAATCTSAFVAQYQVVTSGFTNNTCTTCAGYNNTWTLTTTDAASLDGSVAGNCYAVAMINPCICVSTASGYNDDEKWAMNAIIITAGGAAAIFQVHLGSNDGVGTDCHTINNGGAGLSSMIRWLEFGTKACGTLSSEDIAFFDKQLAFNGCNHDGSGAIVTAL